MEIKTTTKTAKFSLCIRIGLRHVKRQSSNPKSECNFWVNTDFIERNLKHKRGEPIPLNQFSDLVTQTFESSNFINEIGEFFKKNNTMY